MKSNSNLDMNGNEIVKARAETIFGGLPNKENFEGRVVFHQPTNKYCYWDGERWQWLVQSTSHNANIDDLIDGTGVSVEVYPEFKYNDTDAQLSINVGTSGTEENKSADTFVTAIQIANSINYLPYFYNPNLKWANDDGNHYGYFYSDKDGKMVFQNTGEITKLFNSGSLGDVVKNRNLIPKIGPDGDMSGYPFIVDGPYNDLSNTNIWGDAIPTSGCVVSNIQRMPDAILDNRKSENIGMFLGVNMTNNEVYLFDPRTNSTSNTDERLATFVKDGSIKTNRKVTDTLKEYNSGGWALGWNSIQTTYDNDVLTLKGLKEYLNQTIFNYTTRNIIFTGGTLNGWKIRRYVLTFGNASMSGGESEHKLCDFSDLTYVDDDEEGDSISEPYHTILRMYGIIQMGKSTWFSLDEAINNGYIHDIKVNAGKDVTATYLNALSDAYLVLEYV